jgi:hypothetical protein
MHLILPTVEDIVKNHKEKVDLDQKQIYESFKINTV